GDMASSVGGVPSGPSVSASLLDPGSPGPSELSCEERGSVVPESLPSTSEPWVVDSVEGSIDAFVSSPVDVPAVVPPEVAVLPQEAAPVVKSVPDEVSSSEGSSGRKHPAESRREIPRIRNEYRESIAPSLARLSI